MSTTKPKAAAAPAAAKPAATQEKREPLSVPPGGWPADEYTGQAGRFVRDPFTGKRHPAPAEPAEEAPAPGAEPPAAA
nr:hypothetical protein [uncultured Acidovorax sp.]